MNKLISLLLFCSVISNCQSPSKVDKNKVAENEPVEVMSVEPVINEMPVNSEFNNYLSLIPNMSLPYTTSCGNDYPNFPEVIDSLKTKFINGELQSPYRKISTDMNFEIVMNLAAADVLLPIIKTYKKSGEVISSQQMFFGYCGGEPGYYHTEHIIINTNLLITHIDSTWTHEVDSLYNEIRGTEKFEVKKFDYQVLENGEIVKK